MLDTRTHLLLAVRTATPSRPETSESGDSARCKSLAEERTDIPVHCAPLQSQCKAVTMPRDLNESLIFIDKSEYAIRKFFEVIDVGGRVLERIAVEISHLQRLEQSEHNWWMEDGQWEGGNHEFFQYMNRVRMFSRKREELSQGASRSEAVAKLIAESGATELSVAIAAGAVLQVAKQALSFRFGPARALPRADAPCIGSQSALTVIWEGRNHSMHWEEPERPGKTTEWRKVLAKLEVESLLQIREGENMSFEVLSVLGWTTPEHALQALREMVRLGPANAPP